MNILYLIVVVSSSPTPRVWCQGYISSQLVGSIVGLQSEEIKKMAEEYEGKVSATVHSSATQDHTQPCLCVCMPLYPLY